MKKQNPKESQKKKKCVKDKLDKLLIEWETFVQEMKQLDKDLESQDGQREAGKTGSEDGDNLRTASGN